MAVSGGGPSTPWGCVASVVHLLPARRPVHTALSSRIPDPPGNRRRLGHSGIHGNDKGHQPTLEGCQAATGRPPPDTWYALGPRGGLEVSVQKA